MTRSARAALIAALAVGTSVGVTGASEPARAQVSPQATDVVPGEVIVRFRPSASTAARERAADRADASASRPLRGLARTRLLEVSDGRSPEQAARALEVAPAVEWAEPNRRFELARTPNDPSFGSLWGLRNIGQTVNGTAGVAGADISATSAWDSHVGSDQVLVGIVDSGLDPTHPDLVGNLRSDISRNFVGSDPANWDDDNQHGSHVGGTVGAAGSNGTGITGVSWDVGLFAARACNLRGSCTTADTAEALAYAADAGARVVNTSLGISLFSTAIDTAIKGHPNTLYVASAGNDSTNNDVAPQYPCNVDSQNVICVAATNQSDGLAGFSNFGASSVDLGAPGVNVLSSVPNLQTTALDTDITSWTDPEGRWIEESLSGTDPLSYVDTPKPLPSESTLTYGTPFDLGGLDACRVRYFLQLGTSFGQFLFVEASTDGSTWTPIQPAGGYFGSTGWQPLLLEEDLSGFDGQGIVQLRYRLQVSPGAVNEDALVRIFSPSIVCRAPQPAGGAYTFLNGTSMAAPHVAGAAALLFASNPGISASQARSALLGSVDPSPTLADSTASGGRLNVAAALGSAAGFPEPAPTPAQSTSPAPVPVPAPSASTALDLTVLRSADLCAPLPERSGSPKGNLTLGKRQLLINQRVYQAAVRRANAIQRWLDAGIEARDICGGTLTVEDLGAGIEVAAASSESRTTPDPRPVRIRPAAQANPDAIDFSQRQLLVNQRVGQAAVRRANALQERLESGLTGGDIQPGALESGHLAPGLAIGRLSPAPAPPASTTRVASAAQDGGTVELSIEQLRINQIIGQAAVKRTNALLDRLASGIRGSEIASGSLTSESFSAG